MPISRPRRIIALFACLLIGLGVVHVIRRAAACRALASHHASEQSRLSADRARLLSLTTPSALFNIHRHTVAIAWHTGHRRHALHAAWRPWLQVPPRGERPPWPPLPPEPEPAPPPSPTPKPTLVDAFLFHPLKDPEGDWSRPDPSIEDAHFHAQDGPRIHGWFAPARHPRAVVLYCEGNAGNITFRRGLLPLYRDRFSCSILIFDYRGYGRSDGVPTIAGVLDDARAARRWLALRTGVPESSIILVGNSLGGAVAVDLAAIDGACALVLENTFSSLADLTNHHFGRLASSLVAGRLDSASRLPQYHGPLLQSHGDADTVVPYPLGRRLFDVADEPKQFLTIPSGDHNDPPTPAYLDALERFLRNLPDQPLASPPPLP